MLDLVLLAFYVSNRVIFKINFDVLDDLTQVSIALFCDSNLNFLVFSNFFQCRVYLLIGLYCDFDALEIIFDLLYFPGVNIKANGKFGGIKDGIREEYRIVVDVSAPAVQEPANVV